jgi:aminoglycoside phosphotransferase (APT) family kinase protein
MGGQPEAEIDIDEPLVRRLLLDQAPHLADRPLSPFLNGWDNATWRLGDDLAVRVPRRLLGAPLVEHEQRLLPTIAPLLAIPVPTPVVSGRPVSDVYPWSWSVVPWFEGERAATHPPHPSEATALGAFLATLHAISAQAAPSNPFREGPLSVRVDRVTERTEALADSTDAELASVADEAYAAGLAAREADTPVLLHGDLHPRNILTRDGRLAAIIDWGDTTAGDPAVDLATAWWLFEPEHHGAVWSAYGGVSRDLWQRSRAWAAYFGLMFLGFRLADDPTQVDEAGVELGRQQLRRVATSPTPDL